MFNVFNVDTYSKPIVKRIFIPESYPTKLRRKKNFKLPQHFSIDNL